MINMVFNRINRTDLDEATLKYILNCGKQGKDLTLQDVAIWKQAQNSAIDEDSREWINEQCKNLRIRRNKYGFRPLDIVGAKISNRRAFRKLAWDNKETKTWNVSGGVITLPWFADWFCAVFDSEGICTQLNRTSTDGLASYEFDEFFDPDQIDNRYDLELHILMVDRYNELYESGAVEFPSLDQRHNKEILR